MAMTKLKSQALSHFKMFKLLAKTEKGAKIQCLWNDRGGEFNSNEFTSFCVSHGIKRQLTAPYSHQQNGVEERKNRTIMSLVRSTLKDKQLPCELQGEAVSTAVYLLNRSSPQSLQGLTPYEIWTGRKSSIAYLRVFVSLVNVKCTKMPQKKLEDRSTPMVFIGYEVGSNA